MKTSERTTASTMWAEVSGNGSLPHGHRNSSKMVDPDLAEQLLHGSAAAAPRPSCTEESVTGTSGIIPGAIAAAVFISFLLALYAVLWKCMVSPPQRKHSKVRVRMHPRTSV